MCYFHLKVECLDPQKDALRYHYLVIFNQDLKSKGAKGKLLSTGGFCCLELKLVEHS